MDNIQLNHPLQFFPASKEEKLRIFLNQLESVSFCEDSNIVFFDLTGSEYQPAQATAAQAKIFDFFEKTQQNNIKEVRKILKDLKVLTSRNYLTVLIRALQRTTSKEIREELSHSIESILESDPESEKFLCLKGKINFSDDDFVLLDRQLQNRSKEKREYILKIACVVGIIALIGIGYLYHIRSQIEEMPLPDSTGPNPESTDVPNNNSVETNNSTDSSSGGSSDDLPSHSDRIISKTTGTDIGISYCNVKKSNCALVLNTKEPTCIEPFALVPQKKINLFTMCDNPWKFVSLTDTLSVEDKNNMQKKATDWQHLPTTQAISLDLNTSVTNPDFSMIEQLWSYRLGIAKFGSIAIMVYMIRLHLMDSNENSS